MTAELSERLHTTDLDDDARSFISEAGWELRLVDEAGFAGWTNALRRGFLGAEVEADAASRLEPRMRYRRKLGVFDPSSPQSDVPVATFADWIAPLAVPGGDVTACAISSVTVAPTHRRRGIARAMMAGELRRARQVGAAVAMLTATEASIYQRYGFAPAAMAATWTIDPRRVRWIGPQPQGRLDFLERDAAAVIAPSLHERMRGREPGETSPPPSQWENWFGTHPDAEKPGNIRVVAYTSPAGAVEGMVVYHLESGEHGPFDEPRLAVDVLLLASDDAYAAIWRYLLEHDLMTRVTASELSPDEPLRWMIDDPRAAVVSVVDHHYVRILDVVAALEGRTYAAPGRFALAIDDPMEIIGGEFVLNISADGSATVTAGSDATAVGVTLSATALAALYLGEHSARTLRTAGRLSTDDADAVDDAFRSRVTPRLSFWY